MIKYYLTKTIHIHKMSSSTRISEDLPRLHTIETPDNNGYNMELNIKHSRVGQAPFTAHPERHTDCVAGRVSVVLSI